MSHILISVLIRVYNVEKTLDRCIQSFLRQTFQNFEIILINDGSTDGSGAICDEYAKKYKNIKVIHKENEGLGPTRNCGILAAQGEYIYHCDSDDWVKEDLLEKTYSAIKQTDSDMVLFGYDLFTEKDGKLNFYNTTGLKARSLSKKSDIQKLFVENFFNSFYFMSACNRLQKRAFIIENNLFFPALRRSQDMAYSFLIFDKIEKLAIMEESFYCYIIEPGVYKGRSFTEMVDIYKNIYNMAKKQFETWGLLNEDNNQKLINYFCEQIANYSTYAFAVKYRSDWKKNIKLLLNDREIRGVISKYKNQKKSRFMKLFCLFFKLKSKGLLMRLSEKKQITSRG